MVHAQRDPTEERLPSHPLVVPQPPCMSGTGGAEPIGRPELVRCKSGPQQDDSGEDGELRKPGATLLTARPCATIPSSGLPFMIIAKLVWSLSGPSFSR